MEETQADGLHIQLTLILEERTKTAGMKLGEEYPKEWEVVVPELQPAVMFILWLDEASNPLYQGLWVIMVAVILVPEIAAWVGAQLDGAVEEGRLAESAGYNGLPWTNAFIKGAMRWHSLSPLGIAASSSPRWWMHELLYIILIYYKH